ncbi:ATP-binding protein [Chamaesiphon polymorphus]|uniref:histidine kinase n=1 Tax=Chamaesiphon polymorphus CCALA 037 TaxID=2107692 RepID=A0A2T1GK16_9CYAN|nr:ATP-binding protein [Chamaesiphon polymorphus]PSB58171.1 hypothetical protein C7B77_05700 [Chamaesiphon polymorphus CCALA 037]
MSYPKEANRPPIIRFRLNESHRQIMPEVTAIDNGNVRFWVRDTGEGIALEDQERIFNRFARGSNNERRSDGSGLGLSIVQALVKAHHGRLELFSRLGEGANFTAIFPSHRPEDGRSLAPDRLKLPSALHSERMP